MASPMPTILAPDPPDDDPQVVIDANDGPDDAFEDVNALSPRSAAFPRIVPSSVGDALAPPRAPFSPSTASTISTNSSPAIGSDNESSGIEAANSGPFNFQTQSYTVGSPPKCKTVRRHHSISFPTNSNSPQDNLIGRRRGHKYARSSVSHQIILSPTPRVPLQLPTSLPIPTWREFYHSMTKEQVWRARWCFCHLAAAGYIQMRGSHGSLAMTALSHLLFFDALGAFLVVAVDISRNFEVWNRSSVRTPFGLERAEVLAGLAMSIILLFMGLDLISHGLQHALENVGGHEPHHEHEHERIGAGEIDFSALLAVVVTVFSAYLLGNHTRVARTMRVSFLEWLPKVARNPSHLLTLSCSGLLLILPLLDLHTYTWVDPVLGFTMALFMIWLGSGLGYTLGRMLLMSYTDPGVKDVIYELESDSNITAVEEAKVWQVHYELCMGNFKLRVRSLDGIEELRKRVGMLVKNRLGGGYGEGSKGVKWDVNVQISLDRD